MALPLDKAARTRTPTLGSLSWFDRVAFTRQGSIANGTKDLTASEPKRQSGLLTP